MNRIEKVFKETTGPVLNIYLTAGYPTLDATVPLAQAIAGAGAHLIELGIPYSDPLADGPTIQATGSKALENGMNLPLLLEQATEIRAAIATPMVAMSYLNPILQYGIENFCKAATAAGIDGLILPDLPLTEYQEDYKATFEQYGLAMVFLVTPQTPEARIRLLDSESSGFLYAVSSASTTGSKADSNEQKRAYLQRLQAMNLTNPVLVGFGISSAEDVAFVSQYTQGAIIGSAFLRAIGNASDPVAAAHDYVTSIIEPLSQHTTPS